MFLSTENPPNDPLSSSSNLLHLTTTSSHELGQSHLSNFSIRDYAYSNRKKNIKNSWPFSAKNLQLFSSHGVTDPLPPFQKFSCLTNQFETTACSLPSSGKQIVSYVHQGRSLAKLAETRKAACSQSRTIENGQVSKPQVKVLVANNNNNHKNIHSKKTGRGMVKSKEDTCGGGLVTTSESIMAASKTCPICKTFSSASNTTLNAHIDQCLSVDSALPPVCSKPNKPRVKPRAKVKTMLDIYASAKECTLEDLDKRNGTKWVSILSYTNRVVADKSEVSKKRKVSPVGVGPVYIDAKGQKLRILSEFSEKKTSVTPLGELHEDGKTEKKCLSQGSKGNTKCLRKRRRGKKHHKYLKLTNHKTNPSEIPEHQRGLSGEGSNMGHRRIYNQRMLAKRGLISKKLNEKGSKFYALGDQPSENDDDSWSGEDPIVLRCTNLSVTDSSPLNKLSSRNEVAGRNKTLPGSRSAQSRSFRVQMSEQEDESLARVHPYTVELKKSLAPIQEDKHPPGKNFRSDAIEVSDTSPRAASKRKLSPPFVANSWRRLSMPVELKKARLDFSEKEDNDEEETGKWESEMTQERELSDDDYVSGDNGETDEVLLRPNPSSSGFDDYDDDDEESSEEEDNNNKGANVLDNTDDMAAEFYQSDTTPSIGTIPTERAMYYSEEVGDMIYGQTPCEEDVRFDSQVGKGSLFVEVDTIPIPGPPGSFLPSPRDMGFDENLGNSSVITSQVQSSMDQHDRNSSESPVSAVSNFAAGRLNFPSELSSYRENFSSDIPVSYSTATPMSFSVPSHHGTNAEAEPITIDKTIPSRFRNNDHESCCCQRKERISEGITLNHQASHLLQRRAASSSVAMNLTRSPTCLDPNHPFVQSPYMIQQDLDLQSKFFNRTNLNNTVPPSPSNPVLRLMGKDLMVMNQQEGDKEEAFRSSLTPRPQFLDPPPCAGTGLYFNTSLYLRNSFESTHQPQSPNEQAQASTVGNNFDHVRYFPPS